MAASVYFKKADSIIDAIKATRYEDAILDIKPMWSPSGLFCYKVTHTEINPPLELLVVVTHLFGNTTYKIELDVFPN